MKEICRHTLQRLYLYLDGEVLSEGERVEISVHLEECAPCYERYGLDEHIVAAVSRLKNTCTCPESLKNRISGLLEEL